MAEVKYKEFTFKVKEDTLEVSNAMLRQGKNLKDFIHKETIDIDTSSFEKHERAIANTNKQIEQINALIPKEGENPEQRKKDLTELYKRLEEQQEAYWLDSKAQRIKEHYEDAKRYAMSMYGLNKKNLLEALKVHLDGDFSVLDFNDLEGIAKLREEAEKSFLAIGLNRQPASTNS